MPHAGKNASIKMPNPDKKKHPLFITRQAEPLNGGTPAHLLAESFVTPVDRFFVRSHAPTPTIDAQSFRLEVAGLVESPLSLSLDQLRNEFAAHRMPVTLQCAGNRREQFMRIEHVPGEVPWGNEAISNANWEGVLLRDVLDRARIQAPAKHVELIGIDRVVKGADTFAFGGSIPIERARRDDVQLAWSMNDAPLPPIHGYPLRAIVPGYIGARSVKWLGRIELRETESDNFFQARAYRVFPPHVRAADADWSGVPALGATSVNSFITSPTSGARGRVGEIEVRGIAIGAEGSRITRVELSTDDGATWRETTLVGESQPGTWQFWTARATLGVGHCHLVVRAFDELGNAQPPDARSIWNFKGYMNNAWDRAEIVAER